MCFSQFSTCKLAREARLASEHAKEAIWYRCINQLSHAIFVSMGNTPRVPVGYELVY